MEFWVVIMPLVIIFCAISVYAEEYKRDKTSRLICGTMMFLLSGAVVVYGRMLIILILRANNLPN